MLRKMQCCAQLNEAIIDVFIQTILFISVYNLQLKMIVDVTLNWITYFEYVTNWNFIYHFVDNFVSRVKDGLKYLRVKCFVFLL